MGLVELMAAWERRLVAVEGEVERLKKAIGEPKTRKEPVETIVKARGKGELPKES